MILEFHDQSSSTNRIYSVNLDHIFIDSQHFTMLRCFAELRTVFSIDHLYLCSLITLLLIYQSFLLNMLPWKLLDTKFFTTICWSRICHCIETFDSSQQRLFSMEKIIFFFYRTSSYRIKLLSCKWILVIQTIIFI